MGRALRRYYRAENTSVLHHPSADEPWDAECVKGVEQGTRRPSGEPSFHLVPVFRARSFDHAWLGETVQSFQRFLLQSYETVLFTEVDEVVATDPPLLRGDARRLLQRASRLARSGRSLHGYEVIHDPDAETALDWSAPLLRQRSHWSPSSRYCKTLLAKVPLTWVDGFHTSEAIDEATAVDPDPRLLLLHLHRADWATALERHRRAAAKRWSPEDLELRHGWQNRVHGRGHAAGVVVLDRGDRRAGAALTHSRARQGHRLSLEAAPSGLPEGCLAGG